MKTVLWAVGPLKNKKTRHQNIRTSENQETEEVDQTRPDVPKGTVADSVRQKIGDPGPISIRNMFPLHPVTSKRLESPYGAK